MSLTLPWNDMFGSGGQGIYISGTSVNDLNRKAVIGWFIDSRFDTEPYWTLGLLLLGVVGGFVRLVSSLRRLDRMDAPE